MVRYQFTSEEHALPKVPHGNSSYKRQPKSTRDLLKEQVENSKPWGACRQVEKELGGIESNQISTSSLPQNTQQAASMWQNLFQGRIHSDPIMALIDLHKTECHDFIRALQVLPTPACRGRIMPAGIELYTRKKIRSNAS